MSTDSNGVIMYKLKTEISNAKDVQLASREYKMKCDQGKMSVDTESYADPNAIKGFQEMIMGAAMIAQAMGYGPRVVANAAESALEHHLGMTCDPVAGFVQIPCIERCAFGAVKAWTAFCIASEEIEDQRRIDLDTTIFAMAQTAKEMNSKYKETSEGGLAVSVVLC